MARTVDIKKLTERARPSRGGYSVRPMINGQRETFWAPTKTDLKKKVEKALEKAGDERRGVYADPDRPRTYDQLCELRLEAYRHRESSKKTFEANLVRSRQKFGPMLLDQITRHKVELWALDLSEYGLASVTVCNYVDDMERIFDYAIDSGWHLGPNPVRNVDRPACIFEPDPFDSWEIVFEIARAFERIRFPVGSRITRFAAGLGLRPQEVLVARECDLDRIVQTFFVQRTWDDTRRSELQLTKTSASHANLNLTKIAAEVVAEIPPGIRRDPSDWTNSPLLFSRADGSRITPDYFRNKFAEAMGTLTHLAYKPPKRLRDTFATLTLLELGLDKVKTVSTLMRHTSEKVTLTHYAKIVDELKLRAAGDVSSAMPSFAV
jgi:integrase